MKQITLISIIFFSFFGFSQTEYRDLDSYTMLIKQACSIQAKESPMPVYEMLSLELSQSETSSYEQKTQRVKKMRAILMSVLTGLLGGHRLYLGTPSYVPIIYTLTLGGGMGLLPLIDTFVILFTKDLSKYQNNKNIIMWMD